MLPAVELAHVDPVLVLAEVITRLRHAGVPMPSRRGALDAAHRELLELLDALGVPADGEPLSEVDLALLRCAAAPRRGDRARGA